MEGEAAPSRFLSVAVATILALFASLSAHAADPVVSNVHAAQQAGSKRVDVYYDVQDQDGDTQTVSVVVMTNGVPIPASSFTGDIGAGILPGTGKHIVWNAGADWDGKYSSAVGFAVTAYDVTTTSTTSTTTTSTSSTTTSTTSTTTTAGGTPPPAGMVYVQGGTLPDIGNGAIGVSSFLIGKYEVTWTEWQTVRAEATARGYDIGAVGHGCAGNHPAHTVTWYDVVKWCNLLSEIEGRTPVYGVGGNVYRSGWHDDVTVNAGANGYRLPTDAEWEFAARGGTQSHGYEYSGGNDLNAVGWYWDNSAGAACNYWETGHGTWPVGQKVANELGLHDMSGNVWEWCFDWYPGYEGSSRVIRGGGWYSYADYCRVAFRNGLTPDGSYDGIGFRAVLPPGQ